MSCATAPAVHRAAPAPSWSRWRKKLYDDGVTQRPTGIIADQTIDGADDAIGNREQAPTPELKTGWAGAESTQRTSACVVHARSGFDWKAADAYLFDIDGTLLNSRD